MASIKSILLLLGIILSIVEPTDSDKHGRRFKGGRNMYSSIMIELNNDSTYYLSQWMHPFYSKNDTGTWFRTKKDQIILNSTVKSYLRPFGDSSIADYHFFHQKASLQDSVLKLIPKKRRDNYFYAEYYTLYLEGEY